MKKHDAKTDQDRDSALLDEIRQSLDMQAHSIDDSTQDALHKIRLRALAQHKTLRTKFQATWPVYPALAATATAAVVVSIVLSINMNNTLDDLPALDDLPLITATDDIMFYQDLEFYQWLEAENING